MNIDDRSKYFETTRKHNHSATEPGSKNNVSDQVKLGLDTLQFKLNNTTNMTHKKITPYVNCYLFFN